MIEIEIERGITLADSTKRRVLGLPFDTLEVGESFFVSLEKFPLSLGAIAGVANRRLKPKRFASRKAEKDGMPGRRFWRIA